MTAMHWPEARHLYPKQWVLIEAIDAKSAGDRRLVDDLAVVDRFADSSSAWRRYQELHRQQPARELYILHTDRESLDIRELASMAIRPASA